MTSEMLHVQQQCNHKYLRKISELNGGRTKTSPYGIGVTLLSISGESIQSDKLAVPFIETLPAANLLHSGGTLGSHSRFIFAFCRTFAMTA